MNPDPCTKFLQNPSVDPVTGLPLITDSPRYRELVLQCSVLPATGPRPQLPPAFPPFPPAYRPPLSAFPTALPPITPPIPRPQLGNPLPTALPLITTPLPPITTPLPPITPPIPRPQLGNPLPPITTPLPPITTPLPPITTPLPPITTPWARLPQLPTALEIFGPTVADLPVDTYIPQDEPAPGDFAITAAPENSKYIQAAMATARDIYPNLEFYIRIAESEIASRMTLGGKIERLRELARRSGYPSFMRDASPFEIFKIYRGPAAERGRKLMKWIYDHMQDLFEGFYEFLAQNGFGFQYYNIVRTETIQRYRELRPETFQAAITPDQELLMKAWRKRVLTDRQPSLPFNASSILNLTPVRQQLEASRTDDSGERREIWSLKHYQTGFDRQELYRAIYDANQRLHPFRRRSNITVDYLRYEGEEAIDQLGRNRNQKRVPIHANFPKEYYMMLYNELMTRGIITPETERRRRAEERDLENRGIVDGDF